MASRRQQRPAGPKPQGRAPAGSKVGLALAGGVLEGAIYEIGALRALDEALDGLDFSDLHIYVGVSAGAFLAANLANNLTTGQMCRAIVKHEKGEHPFDPKTFRTPALRELRRRGKMLPRLLWDSLKDYAAGQPEKRLVDSFSRLARALPVGVFDNDPMRAYVEKIYSIKGRTNDFRELDKQLVVVAVDLDNGEATLFGQPPDDDVPISKAVQASSALPGLYPPVEIKGRHYVDGVLRKTLHASVAFDAGADLVICLNPIVPVDTRRAVEEGVMKRGKLVDRGFPSVISQTLRTIVRSRLTVGLASYDGRFGDAEVVLIEPRRDDYRMFFNNIFSFGSRRDVCAHAYDATRRDLLERQRELGPLFARHGIKLRVDVLEDKSRELWKSVGISDDPGSEEMPARPGVMTELDAALDRLEAALAD